MNAAPALKLNPEQAGQQSPAQPTAPPTDEPTPENPAPPPPPPTPPVFPEQDDQRAQMFREWLDGDFKYIYSWKQWALWTDDEGWRLDPSERQALAITQKAREWGRSLLEMAQAMPAGNQQNLALTLAKRALGHDHIKAMIDFLKGDEAVATTDFDSDPFLLGVQNGVVDLRDGSFRDAEKEDMILKKCSVPFNPNAKCPMWEEFIEQIQPDEKVREYLRRMIGYGATGVTTEQVLFFLYGMGQNGKSTFIQTIKKLFNDYAWQESAMLFLESGANDDKRNMLASLPEKRFVVGAEMPDGAHLAESRIKDLTGGDTINARKLFCEAFNFTPTHKLFFYGNHRPIVRGTDQGIWRRINLIPFSVEIPEAKRDRGIVERLWTEREGILNWIIEGALEWQKTGLRPPEAVRIATDEYREDEDLVKQFVDEQGLLAADVSVEYGRFSYAFELWMKDRGYKFTMSPRAFCERIARIPGVSRHRSNGKRYWKGIGLKDEAAFRGPR